MIDIIQIPLLSDNYSYIIIDKKTKITACVDPSEVEGIENILKEKKTKLDFILNTHHHNDHVGGNLELKKKYGCKIIGSFSDQNRIPGIDIKLKENETFNLGESLFTVIETPGHTIGHICFYFKKQRILFSGDTLFSLGCGRLFEGTYEQMINSLLKIRSLPNETKIYCGHEYTESNSKFAKHLNSGDSLLNKKITDIKNKRAKLLPTIPSFLSEEKTLNPFLLFDDEEYLKSINMTEGLTMIENFKKMRMMKDQF